ncbi:MAG: hypothetical protein FOGNACKC_02605 [Anaerolineae bacterium]|nr:hypothetical protein [Anaerolineae bacterium]
MKPLYRQLLAGLLALILLRPLPVWADGPTLGGCPLFPVDNIWNTPIDQLPVDASSSAYITSIGATTRLHADFGAGEWPPGSGSKIGIPFVVVPASQPLVAITSFLYASQSDPGPYPIPPNAPIEGAPSTSGDRHVLVLRQGECKLYELYRAFPNGNGTWRGDSGAVFTLTGHTLRPDGWTSADAAGLPILPGLARYDEVLAGEIKHALRFTAPQTRRGYVWPARHFASSNTSAALPPMGQRFRLKASFVIDNSFSPQGRVLLRAMQKYGLILADNGSAWYISGAPDERWDNDALTADFNRVRGSDFEAVNVSSLQISANSGQVVGFGLAVTPAGRAVNPGASVPFTLTVSYNGSFSQPVALTAVVSPALPLQLQPTGVSTTGSAVVTLTDTHSGQLLPGVWHTLWLTATGGGLTRTAQTWLLVGGSRVYLPLLLKP